MSVHTKLEPARKTERKRVLMIATVITCTGNHRVRIRDMSRKGAQVVAQDNLTVGCDVLLQRDGLCSAARVAWVKGEEVGLTFYRELSPADVTGTLPGTVRRSAD